MKTRTIFNQTGWELGTKKQYPRKFQNIPTGWHTTAMLPSGRWTGSGSVSPVTTPISCRDSASRSLLLPELGWPWTILGKYFLIKYEESHLAWVDVYFLGDFSYLSWASIKCNWAGILICWCQSLQEYTGQRNWPFMVLGQIYGRSDFEHKFCQ